AISGTSATAVISGLIGEKGVVGAFVNTADRVHFAGGFWAVPILGDEPDKNDKVVNFSDWKDSFGRATPPPTTPTRLQNNNTESQFLTGNATVVSGKGLNEAGSISGVFGGGTARFSLSFGSNTTYNGRPLGVDATGGVGGFAVTVSGTGDNDGRYRYAGLLSSTDLGAPINSVGQSGAWRGRFVGIRRDGGSFFSTVADFTLNVTFNAGGGGTLTMASIDDSVSFNDHTYTMTNGKHNARGVISGAINYRDQGGAVTAGILTGLIGQDGAVGAFISGTAPTIGDGDEKDIGNISEHNHTKPRFFGGFVASQPLPPAPTDTSMANYENFE
ncbi:MAG: hypothetical protein K8953_08030, partial [Proteobacteria bacterium]|nr:hypothetical protein [Pseudomonadota bacterium]